MFRFPLMADVYYATESQDDLGSIVKRWTLGRSDTPCELRTDKFNSDSRFAVDTKEQFFDIELILFGRFEDDIRINQDGDYRSISNILITNIRTRCDGASVFIETYKDGGEAIASIFEVRTLQPFTNPWGKIEYYKVQLFRSDDQYITESIIV